MSAIMVLCHFSTEPLGNYICKMLKHQYSIIIKKWLAVFYGVKTFYNYHLDRLFVTCMDHSQHFNGCHSKRYKGNRRWSLTFHEHDFDIKYCKWANKANEDTLSRLDSKPHMATGLKSILSLQELHNINYISRY